jgi:hypothetical protein
MLAYVNLVEALFGFFENVDPFGIGRHTLEPRKQVHAEVILPRLRQCGRVCL